MLQSYDRSNSHPQKSSIPARVIAETPLHRVETYGLPLPVQVNEIISAAGESMFFKKLKRLYIVNRVDSKIM